MKLAVVGTLYSKDKAGFLKLVSDANEHMDTHTLVAVFQLEDKLAALFRKREKNEPGGAFFSDDPFGGF